MAPMDDNVSIRGSAIMPRYTASDIANYFLYKAQEDNQELLSNLKLQKLVYYAQGLSLVVFDRPLFEENIEAWTYGPVIPFLYHKYKEYGSRGICVDDDFDPSIIDDETKDFLDEVYSVFGQFSAVRLMDIAHGDQCWIDAGIGNEITCDSMRQCLKKYLKDG
jgi:uncharacterized phage-associated protein